jgi:Tfp pilus assembly major pilin PilA
LLGKKMAQSVTLKSWQLAVAVVAGVAVILGGVGIFAYQSYTQAQISAATAADSAIEFGEQRIEETSGLIDELELAIRNSEESLVNTVGQTLDEQDRQALLAEIETSKETWVEQKTKLLELEAAVKALKTQLALETPPKEALVLLAERITELANLDWSPSATQIVALGEKIKSLETAQSAWQKEMTRLAEVRAAEIAAAQLAEIERAAAESKATQATEINSIPAPPSSIQPVTDSLTRTPEMEEVENFILNLASNITFLWDPDLCDPGYVCGQAIPAPYSDAGDFLYEFSSTEWGYTGSPRTPEHSHVFVKLDNSLQEFYTSTSLGRAILVHEAAHVRQWLKYGLDIISANEGYSGRVGTPAVEYMADCATIALLGYSTGSYTVSCTPSELEAAATIW